MTTKTRDTELLLRRTLHAKAAQLAPDVDPARESMLTAVVVDAAPHRARGARRALAIAAVVVVVALIAGVVASTQHDASRRPAPTTIAPVDGSLGYATPTGAMAPSYVPDGLQLWSMQTTRGSSNNATFSTEQLFGKLTGDGAPDPGILVETMLIGDGVQVFPGAATVVSVHGQRAAVEPSKDAGAASTEIDWVEDGVLIRATIRGLEPAAAASALDAMRPRASGVLDGLDPATAPEDLPLLAEDTPLRDAHAGTRTLLAYGSAAPTLGATPEVTITADTSRAYPGYLLDWIAGTGNATGSEKYDPPFGFYLDRPDGTSVVVSSPTLGEADLRRIAHSVATADTAETASMQKATERRIEALPLAATADAGNGVTLELRGDAADPTTICATHGTDRVCAPPVAYDQGPSIPRLGTYGSVLLDGRWFVFTAAIDPVRITAGARPRPQDPVPDVAGLVTGIVGPWHFAAAVIPDGTPQVGVEVATSDNQSTGLSVVDPR